MWKSEAEEKVRVMRCEKDLTSCCCLEVGGREHGWLLQTKKGKEMDSSTRFSRRECRPADTLILARGDLCQTSDVHNCQIITLCCFNPLYLR